MDEIIKVQREIFILTQDLIEKVNKLDHKGVKDFILFDLKQIQDRHTVVENTLRIKAQEKKDE